MPECCEEIEAGLLSLEAAIVEQTQLLTTAVDLLNVIAFVAWAGVGYLAYRLMVRRNWRVSS